MINTSANKNNYLLSGLFLLTGICIIFFTKNHPVGDFGNYYFGSKLLADGKFSILDYQSISHFNAQIAGYGIKDYFENYTPVPPFSLVFYLPFTFLSCLKAKLLFNGISLLLFCFSLQRLLNYIPLTGWQLYTLPLIFLYPLYNNIYQGQSYLLITAALIEAYIAQEQKKYWLAALFISLSICLKLFPAFILFYFILKKNYRTVIYTLGLIALCCTLTIAIAGWPITWNYATVILPRLMNNDIVGAYYHGNQSLYTFLLNVFSYEEIQNKNHFFNIPWVIPAIEGVYSALVICVLYEFRKKERFLFFGITLLCGVLIGRYNTSYSMLLLIPFAVALTGNDFLNKKTLIILCILFIAVSAPIGKFVDSLLVFQYLRITGLVMCFIFLALIYKPNVKAVVFLPLAIIILCFKYATFSLDVPVYFEVQNTQGILYDYEIQKDSITLISTTGNHSIKETVYINGNMKADSALYIKNNRVYFHQKVICNTADNKRKPFIYNNSVAVLLSDQNQAVGVYKLRCIDLP